MRAFAFLPMLVLPLAACSPPENAVVVRCTSAGIAATNPEKHCTVTQSKLKGASTTSFEAQKFRHNAHVVADFKVKEGTVKISIRGTGEPTEFTVTPDAPQRVEVDTRLNRTNRTFTMRFESEAGASGLEGTVNYRAQ